ncbi:MAG: hypothetical protein IKH95_05945 [Bacteroidaceae bacterium]|nr:hypothetical protein [Bacteroidaceae bacterium]
MKLSNKSKVLIDQVISSVIKHYSTPEESVITDIHFQPWFNSGELKVFDDDDEVISNVIISEFEGLGGADAIKDVSLILRRSLDYRRKELENLFIIKPYSFVLVDEDKETIEDLLLIDDDIVIAEDGLLQGLDEELEEFLKKLLSDN